ncbi:hypothetical protein HDU78_003578 [Chytriomyces hyalinus]|nr:hypothetical protein HDU78_003578 [Chytriomyces hyalinus]
MNWAKRGSCNVCHAPKPGTGQGSREGNAGGYKERDDVVEYRETRFNSDDEYDDFGRKRKKKNTNSNSNNNTGSSSSVASHANDPPPAKTENNEADDDEDEDDGKWDAWADVLGEDAKDLLKKKNERESGSKRDNDRNERDYSDSRNRNGRDEKVGRGGGEANERGAYRNRDAYSSDNTRDSNEGGGIAEGLMAMMAGRVDGHARVHAVLCEGIMMKETGEAITKDDE